MSTWLNICLGSKSIFLLMLLLFSTSRNSIMKTQNHTVKKFSRLPSCARHDVYSGEPNIYNDVRYEQACLLFNLGGLYSQLGANEARLTDEVSY